jgi:hypothetical protein
MGFFTMMGRVMKSAVTKFFILFSIVAGLPLFAGRGRGVGQFNSCLKRHLDECDGIDKSARFESRFYLHEGILVSLVAHTQTRLFLDWTEPAEVFAHAQYNLCCAFSKGVRFFDLKEDPEDFIEKTLVLFMKYFEDLCELYWTNECRLEKVREICQWLDKSCKTLENLADVRGDFLNANQREALKAQVADVRERFARLNCQLTETD